MEEVAGRIVTKFDEWFRDSETGGPTLVLVRLFKTHVYQYLPAELQAIVRERTAPDVPKPEMRCLTLLGTTGLGGFQVDLDMTFVVWAYYDFCFVGMGFPEVRSLGMEANGVGSKRILDVYFAN